MRQVFRYFRMQPLPACVYTCWAPAPVQLVLAMTIVRGSFSCALCPHPASFALVLVAAREEERYECIVAKVRPQALALFKHIDKDDSGALSKTELRHIVERYRDALDLPRHGVFKPPLLAEPQETLFGPCLRRVPHRTADACARARGTPGVAACGTRGITLSPLPRALSQT